MSSSRINYFIACESGDLISLQEVVQHLCTLGHSAALTKDQEWSWRVFELAIDPNGTRVLVQIGEDLHKPSGADAYGDLEILADLVIDQIISEEESVHVHRFVTVGHWDHADQHTIDALIALLCEQMHGRIIAYPSFIMTCIE